MKPAKILMHNLRRTFMLNIAVVYLSVGFASAQTLTADSVTEDGTVSVFLSGAVTSCVGNVSILGDGNTGNPGYCINEPVDPAYTITFTFSPDIDELMTGINVFANAGGSFTDGELRGFDLEVDHIDRLTGAAQTLVLDDQDIGDTTSINDPRFVPFVPAGAPGLFQVSEIRISQLRGSNGGVGGAVVREVQGVVPPPLTGTSLTDACYMQADWTSATQATFTRSDGSTVGLTLSGPVAAPSLVNQVHAPFWNDASAFSPARTDTNRQTPQLSAAGNLIVTFSEPVDDPIMNLWSLGNGGAVRPTVTFDRTATIIRETTLDQVTANSVRAPLNSSGVGGNGSVQIEGVVTTFTATANQGEFFWGTSFALRDATITSAACGSGIVDRSDAPASFEEATHIVSGALQLGATVDADISPATGSNADGDNDDGITIPTLTQGGTATITAEVTGASGFLQGWIDFDGSGTFEAGEQVATDLQDGGADDTNAATGLIDFTVAVPLDAVTTQTFARFRWSTQGGLDVSAAAPDGEVEDYAISIAEAPTLPPANMSIEVCAAPGTGAFPAQPAVADGQVFWTGNTPAQTLNATLNGSDFASAEPFSVGPGASLNFLGTGVAIAGIDQTSAANAFANGDYVDYSFTTAADLPAGRALSNVSRQSLFSTTFNFDMTVIVSDDPTFGSAHLVVEDARVNQAPRTFHAFSTPLALEPSTQYYVRVLTYNNNTPSGLVGYDDLVLSTELCADYSDTPASFTNVTHAQQVEVQTHFLGAGISNDVGVLASPSADADDDDGITIPALAQGGTATITAEVTGAGGFLQGWIDFDGSGTFEAGEQVATDLQDGGADDTNAATGLIDFTVAVPLDAVTTQTFARFRWSTQGGLDVSAAAPDGEVEDYAISIVVPAGPPVCTILTANGLPAASTASHTILTASSPANQLAWEALPGPALFFGSVEATYEGNFSSNSTAFGVINRNWTAGTHANSGNGINYSLNGIYSSVDRIVLLNDVNAPNTDDGIANFTVNLYDNNGVLLGAETFTASSTFALQTFVFGATYHNVASYDLVINTAFTRAPVQYSEVALQGSALTCGATPVLTDQSDAPITGTSFGVASHVIASGIQLGATITADNVISDSPGADSDIDDGITIPALMQGATATITADVTGASGFLQGWIDFDGSGTFEASEQIASDLQDDGNGDDATADDGAITVDIAVPSDAVTTETFARFRWSTQAGLDPTAAAPDGEVEDYAVTILPDPLAGLAPFTCTGDFYQVHGTPTSSVSRVDLAAGSFNTIANTGANARATGLDPNSLYAYAIQAQGGGTAGNVMFAIGSNGAAINLGTVTGLAARNYPSGDFGPGGLFYVRNNGRNRPLVGINVATMEVETQHTPTGLTNNPNTADFAFNPVDQSFYAVESNSTNARLLRFSLNAGTTFTVESVGLTGISTRGNNGNNVFGAMYADSSGNVYGIRNSTGRLYQFSTTDGSSVIVGQGAIGAQNDGFSCSQVETVIPRDFGDAQTDGTIVAGITTNYGEASQARDPGNLFIGLEAPTAEESNVNASDNADGDVNDDAVLVNAFQGDTTYTANLSVLNNIGSDAFLCGFIDAGAGGDGFDGTFDTGDERVCATVASNNAAQNIELNWTGLDFGTNATTFLRLRLATIQSEAEAPTGDGASIGEVEDYAVTIAPAAQPPFVCTPQLLQSFVATTGAPAQLATLNPLAAVFDPIGNTAHGISYNAIGQNPQDGFLYGMKAATNELVRIGSDGSVVELGPIAGLPLATTGSGSYISGDFNGAGQYVIAEVLLDQPLYTIDITTRSVVATHSLSGIGSFPANVAADIGYNPISDTFYTVTLAGTLIEIDIQAGTASTVGPTGIATSAVVGAVYGDSAGRILGSYNDGQGVFQFDLGTGAGTFISPVPPSGINDGGGALCQDAALDFPPIIDLNSIVGDSDRDFGPTAFVEDGFEAGGNAIGSGPVAIADTDADISDVREADLITFTIVVDLPTILDGDDESLNFSGVEIPLASDALNAVTVNGTDFQIDYNATTGIFTITNDAGAATPMPQNALDELLRGTTYIHASDEPTEGTRNFALSVSDATFTSTPALTSVTVTGALDQAIVSGTVFLDNGSGAGATAHDGLLQGDEFPKGEVTVEAVDIVTGNVVATSQTSGDGTYALNLPPEQNGVLTAVRMITPSRTVLVSNRSTFPLAEVDPTNGVFIFTPNAGDIFAGLNFGIVEQPRLTEDQTRAIGPSGTTAIAHTFSAETAMEVSFALENVTQSVDSTFTATLFSDDDCDGALDSGGVPISASVFVAAGDQMCVLVRVVSDLNAASGATLDYDLEASAVYTGLAPDFNTALNPEVLTNSDRVTISNGGNLTLTKEVCNTTIGACDVLLGTGFSLANTGAPGDVLTYRIVFEVTGSTPVDSLEIADITPAYSRLAITAPSVVIEPDGVSCSLSDPAAPTQGYEGVLKWVCTGSVAPGSLGIVAFDVRISQ